MSKKLNVPCNPQHLIELDASQAVIKKSIGQIAKPTIHVSTDLSSNQELTHSPSANHLETALRLLGPNTQHQYILSGFVLAGLLIVKLSEITLVSNAS